MADIYDLDTKRQADLAATVMEVLDEWGVAPEHQILLLGLPESTKPRALKRYRSGTPLPEDPAILKRVSLLLSIQRAVHRMNPHSAAAANFWVTSPNPRFNRRTPLQIMVEGGLDGIERMVQHLEGTSEWG